MYQRKFRIVPGSSIFVSSLCVSVLILPAQLYNATAPPATVWKGYLTFGLVSFPIRLHAAARPQPVHFHMLHRTDLSRVREVMFCAAEDKPLERSDIVKGYEYEKDKYVVIEPEDPEKIAPLTAETMEILQFVRMSEIDPIFLETSYYVAPEQAVSRPYSLLFEAMKQTSYDAVAKVAMHGREHIVILRPSENGIVLHTMYFTDELHSERETQIPGPARFDNKELDLARKLIETLAAPFDPAKFHDEYKANVERMIEAKRKGKKVTPINRPKQGPVVDLMQALQQSLAKNSKASAPKKAARKKSRSVA